MSGCWQLLREWPPGYGGVERVAHELADHWQQQGQRCTVFSLAAQPNALACADPLPVGYPRTQLPSLVLGRLVLPLPGRWLWRLLTAPEPLHVHLPCPAVLALAVLARGLRPRRRISLHWHSFLEPAPTPSGRLFGLYQRLALAALPLFRSVITTSPVLAQSLVEAGMPADRVQVLPCCLPAVAEQAAARAASARLDAAAGSGTPIGLVRGFRLLSIGRLDSYKRVDWLIDAVAALRQASPDLAVRLDVVGDGPDRSALEALAAARAPGQVWFHGRLDEAAKQRWLEQADLLVLAANRSNEAFGIVQLEAMASAVPALAFRHPRSGMHWVSQVPCLSWDGTLAALVPTIAALAADPFLLAEARQQSRQRYGDRFAREIWTNTLLACFPPDAVLLHPKPAVISDTLSPSQGPVL